MNNKKTKPNYQFIYEKNLFVTQRLFKNQIIHLLNTYVQGINFNYKSA